MVKTLPKPLRSLVRNCTSTLGKVLLDVEGRDFFGEIETIRKKMKSIRSSSSSLRSTELDLLYNSFQSKSPEGRYLIAHAFGLYMEVINVCENAYRSHRIKNSRRKKSFTKASRITFVLTAHPTEARSVPCIQIFAQIQTLLEESLGTHYENTEENIRSLLALAWKIPMSHGTRPSVRDEAEHIFWHALSRKNIQAFAEARNQGIPLFLRTWVGGDKDGHPGVGPKQLKMSLQVSRERVLDFISEELKKVIQLFSWLKNDAKDHQNKYEKLSRKLSGLEDELQSFGKIREGEGPRLRAFHVHFEDCLRSIETALEGKEPHLRSIHTILDMMPALLVPLELRESAEAFHHSPQVISSMLSQVHRIAGSENFRWYVRGLVISMVSSAEDFRVAFNLTKKILGKPSLPVIPLFETRSALEQGTSILEKILSVSEIKTAVHSLWKSQFETMLGYSDSSKEFGAWPSRLEISMAMWKLERFLLKKKLQPIFFHGTGGSVARGGGSLHEQIECWPKSARKIFKVTLQGEMIHRSLASPEIALSQFEKIAGEISRSTIKKLESTETLLKFTSGVENAYREIIENADNLGNILKVTPYHYLDQLKIGSRPSKRKPSPGVKGLRAIPWVLCWTQTRILFPSWWGLGQAWKNLSQKEKKDLRGTYSSNALFRSYVKLAGFTLEKVELDVFELYLHRMAPGEVFLPEVIRDFRREYRGAKAFVQEVSGEKNLLWFRPWLRTSIRLRSSMIHPLNVLQILALKNGEEVLLRETATGISSGMLTTG